jgi:hypothetical protein
MKMPHSLRPASLAFPFRSGMLIYPSDIQTGRPAYRDARRILPRLRRTVEIRNPVNETERGAFNTESYAHS